MRPALHTVQVMQPVEADIAATQALRVPQDVHARLFNVTQAFPRRGQEPLVALGPITLEIIRGKFFSVVGPSGCGKSTMLDLLAGLTAPTEGDVYFEGRKVDQVPDGVGVVFQEDASFPWLTVTDNVAYGLRRAGVDAAEVMRRVDYALGLMGLRDFAKAYPVQLSGGMRQRVCIARTLVLQPRFILLDEPFGALDQQTRLLMGDELLKLWRETGATVLLITHSIDEAVMLADKVGVLSARPGRFVDFVETEWPANRDSRIVSDPVFGRYTARIWSTLRDESLKLMQSSSAGAAH
jgi:NitT/TauT family transport system ATP-binding protein